MCFDYGDRDTLDGFDEATMTGVRDYGWSVVMIDADPGWAFTVGLWHSHREPELAMFGLDVDRMKKCLNDLGGQAVAGAPLVAEQHRHDVLEKHPVALKSADRAWCEAFFGGAITFYRRTPIPFLQVVWPDDGGFLPWQDGSDAGVHGAQPSLWLDPQRHPPGIWTKGAAGHG